MQTEKNGLLYFNMLGMSVVPLTQPLHVRMMTIEFDPVFVGVECVEAR